MPYGATQDRWVMVESSEKLWFSGEGNGKPLQYSCLGNPMESKKRQKDRTLKDELPGSVGAQYATADQWRNNFRKNEEMESKQKQHPAVDVTGDGSKVWCCKEQYCIGTWNVKSMNQGKLEEVKQEMARVNINILGISRLKWTGMGEFNSDDHYIYYCRQECLRRNGVAFIVNKSLKCSTWMQSQKWQDDLCSFPRQPFNILVIQVYAPTSNIEEAEAEQFYEDLQDLLELTPKKNVLFIIGDWNAKVGSEETPGVTGKFGLGAQNEAGQSLNRVPPRERTGHSKHPRPKTQENTLHMDSQIVNTEIRLIIFFAAKV